MRRVRGEQAQMEASSVRDVFVRSRLMLLLGFASILGVSPLLSLGLVLIPLQPTVLAGAAGLCCVVCWVVLCCVALRCVVLCCVVLCCVVLCCVVLCCGAGNASCAVFVQSASRSSLQCRRRYHQVS